MHNMMVSLIVAAAVVVMSGGAGRAASSAVPCLEYAACYNEMYLHHNHMTILHEDHAVRTASSCLPICLESRPSSQLVMAKIIDMNERLVCGCGDKEALGSGKGTTNDLSRCDSCPDGTEKCGGVDTVSIYRVVESGRCREGLHSYPQTTTITTTTTTTTPSSNEGDLVIEPSSKVNFLGYIELGSRERSGLRVHLQQRAGDEAERCLTKCISEDAEYRYGFLRPLGGAVYCGCG